VNIGVFSRSKISASETGALLPWGEIVCSCAGFASPIYFKYTEVKRSNWRLSRAVIGFHIMSITFFLQRSGGNCSVALERIFSLSSSLIYWRQRNVCPTSTKGWVIQVTGKMLITLKSWMCVCACVFMYGGRGRGRETGLCM
jgi:hypothetical protein